MSDEGSLSAPRVSNAGRKPCLCFLQPQPNPTTISPFYDTRVSIIFTLAPRLVLRPAFCAEPWFDNVTSAPPWIARIDGGTGVVGFVAVATASSHVRRGHHQFLQSLEVCSEPAGLTGGSDAFAGGVLLRAWLRYATNSTCWARPSRKA